MPVKPAPPQHGTHLLSSSTSVAFTDPTRSPPSLISSYPIPGTRLPHRLGRGDQTRAGGRRSESNRPGVWRQLDSGRVEHRFEPLVLAATLALIPVFVIEAEATSSRWRDVAFAANWLIWLAFAVELAFILAVAPRKAAALRAHWRDAFLSGPGRSRTSARGFEVRRSSAELRGHAAISVGRGVAEGTRTPDHRDHNPGLYQLSYRHRAARTG
jgi:hypothetical protein